MCLLALACSGRIQIESEPGVGAGGAPHRVPAPLDIAALGGAFSGPFTSGQADAGSDDITLVDRTVQVVVQAQTPSPTPCADGQDCAPYFTREDIYYLRRDGVHVAPRSPTSLPVVSRVLDDDNALALGGDGASAYWLRRSSPTSLAGVEDRAVRSGIGPLGAYPVLTRDADGWWFSRGFPQGTTLERLTDLSSSRPPIALIQGKLPIDRFVQSGETLIWTETRYAPCRTPQLYSAVVSDGVASAIRAIDRFAGCTYRLQIQDGYAYWVDLGADANQGAIRRVPLDTPDGAVEPLAQHLNFPEGLAVDGQYVYFTINQEGSVLYRLLADGSGSPERLVRFPYHVSFVDDELVWGYSDDGEIVRVAK